MCLCDDENCLNLGQQSLGLKISTSGTRGPGGKGQYNPPPQILAEKYLFSMTKNNYMSINNQCISFLSITLIKFELKTNDFCNYKHYL